MKNCFISLMLLLTTATLHAVSYVEVYDYSIIIGDNPVDFKNGVISNPDSRAAATDGQYIYHILTNGGKPVLTRVDPVTKLTDTIVNTEQWQEATGSTSMSAMYNLSVQDDSLLFSETSTSNVWSVNKNTGDIRSIANYAQIASQTPGTADSRRTLLSPADGYNGSYYFYEKYSQSILTTNGENVSMYLPDTKLMEIAATTTVSGGITFGCDGKMMWGSNDTDSIYSWDGTTETGQMLLSASEIMSVTGVTSGVTFGDMFYAPDGNVYFFDARSGSIMSFDCLDVLNTLEVVLSKQELLDGPLSGSQIFSLTWYNDNLAFSSYNQTGFYSVPEPLTMSLLGLGGIALIQRKKRH